LWLTWPIACLWSCSDAGSSAAPAASPAVAVTEESLTRPTQPPAASRPAQPTAAPRAFRVSLKGAEAGFLGEGKGPFITKARSHLPNIWLEHLRFTSSNFTLEAKISEVLDAAKSFDAAADELKKLGYTLEPIAYEQVFAPPEQSAVRDPWGERDSGAPSKDF
jgi:hypothetical protein